MYLIFYFQPKEESSCYFSLLKETLAQIDRTLKDWRKSNDRQKAKQLYKLKQLRQLYLLFAHHIHKYQLIMNYFEKLKVEFRFSDLNILHKDTNIKDELQAIYSYQRLGKSIRLYIKCFKCLSITFQNIVWPKIKT